MSRPLDLAAHVHAVAIGEDLVLLDVRCDAYHCIPDGVATLSFDGRARTLAPQDAEASDALLALGLVDKEAPRASPRRLPPYPSRGLPERSPARVSAYDLMNLLGALLDLTRHYRGRAFPDIVAAARRPARRARVAQPALRDEEVERLAQVFQRAVVWMPAPRKCLARSFLLLRFLQRSGADADWVFAVRTWPFGAHCWLQAGELVLDDHPEQLAIYQPLCAL